MNEREIIIQLIIQLISNRTKMLNMALRENNKEAFERFRHEINGMLICLRNVSTDVLYCLNILEDKCEFGYYDNSGFWYTIED